MRGRGEILLVSTYELGHQPLALASPLAWLRGAGYDAVAVDASVEPLGEGWTLSMPDRLRPLVAARHHG